MAKPLSHCPVCEGELIISELSCERCATRVHSMFEPCRFCSLQPEHLAFIELFLRCEGNLSRVEKELGVSYPTVRNRLTSALSALGFAGPVAENAAHIPPPTAVEAQCAPPSEDASARRREALNALARGEISADDAARVLRDLT